jgi:hypothetical protein
MLFNKRKQFETKSVILITENERRKLSREKIAKYKKNHT